MKTLHITNTSNANQSHKRVRSIMTLTGIVTAMLCLVLMQEVPFTESMDARVPRVLESSRIVAVDLLAELKTWL